MFKDTPDGQTHSFPVSRNTLIEEIVQEFERKFCVWNDKWSWAVNSDANPQEVKTFLRTSLLRISDVSMDSVEVDTEMCCCGHPKTSHEYSMKINSSGGERRLDCAHCVCRTYYNSNSAITASRNLREDFTKDI